MGALHLSKYAFISFILISLTYVEGSSISTQSASESTEVESSLSNSYEELENPQDDFVPLIRFNKKYEEKRKSKVDRHLDTPPEKHIGQHKRKTPEGILRNMPWKVKAFMAISLILLALLLSRFMGKATAMTYAPLLYFAAFWIYLAIELMALYNPKLEIYTVYISFAVGIIMYAFNYVIDGGSDALSDLALFLMFVSAKFLFFKSIPKLWAYVNGNDEEPETSLPPNLPPQ